MLNCNGINEIKHFINGVLRKQSTPEHHTARSLIISQYQHFSSCFIPYMLTSDIPQNIQVNQTAWPERNHLLSNIKALFI